MKVRLVDNWRSCWRWISVICNALNTAFLATWATLPSKYQDALPLPWVIGIALALLVTGTIGRLVKQGDTNTNNVDASK